MYTPDEPAHAVEARGGSQRGAGADEVARDVYGSCRTHLAKLPTRQRLQ